MEHHQAVCDENAESRIQHAQAPHFLVDLTWHQLGGDKAPLSTATHPGHTAMATCGHRVHEAFDGDFGLPEVQHRWRRSRDLPCRR
jgi:hypothetical protein